MSGTLAMASKSRRVWLLAFITFIGCAVMKGQMLEKDAVKVSLRGKIAFNVSDQWNFSLPELYFGDNQFINYQEERVELVVGREYTAFYAGSGVSNVLLQVEKIPGYRIYLNGVHRNRVAIGGDISVRLEPDSAPIPTGEASSLRPGRIVWTVGLGSLMGGRSAGVISLREMGFTANTYKPSALIYDTDSPEVWRAWGTEHLRQIYTPNCLVDITADNDSRFRLKFYPRNTGQIGPLTGGYYSVSGDPTFEFVVENPDAPSLLDGIRITRIVRQGGSTHTMWTEMRSSTNGPQVIDWVDKPDGATSVIGPVQRVTGYTALPYGGSKETINTTADGWTNVLAEERTYYGGELTHTKRGWGTGVTKAFSYDADGQPSAAVEDHFGATHYRYYGYSPGGFAGNYADFDRGGQLHRVFKPFGATAADPNNAAIGEVTTYDYTADWTGQARLPSSIITTINNVETARSEISYVYPPGSSLLVATKKEYYGTESYHTTVTATYREDTFPSYLAGKTHSVRRPDGTATVNLFFPGTFNTSTREFTTSSGGAELLILTLNGTSVPSAESAPLTSFTLGSLSRPTESDFRVAPNISTASVIIQAADGLIVSTQKWICVGTTAAASWQVVERDVLHYAGFFHVRTSRDSGAPSAIWDVLTNVWSSGRLTESTDEQGTKTEFTYDSSGRVRTKKRTAASHGGATVAAVTTTFDYDAAGHCTKETVSSAGTSETLTSHRTYDNAGRITSETTPGYATAGSSTASAVTVSYDYDTVNRKVTNTLPGSVARVEEKLLDGRPKAITGTGIIPEFYTYGVETDGRTLSRISYAAETSVRKREQWTDKRGRIVTARRPGFTGQPSTEEINVYDDYSTSNTGRLIASETTGRAMTRFEYNTMAQTIRFGLDVGTPAGLQTASPTDRITDTAELFEYHDNAWWLTTTISNYPFAGSSAAKEVSKVRKRLTGLTATLRAETRTYDAEGNEIRVITTVDAANKLVTVTTKRPGMANDHVLKSLNGLLIETTSHDGLTFKKRYDALGRLVGEIDPRTGTETNHSTKYTYHPNTTWVKEVKDAANKRLSFTHYDVAGRVIYTEDAAGKTTRTSYTARGEVEKVWGTATYPVSYVYNSYGERIAMRTYRDPNDAALTDNTTFPALGTYDETTWEFDAPSGLLKKKTDAKGKFVEYTYNLRGQTHERFWSRVVPGSNPATRVKATFAYDSATGENTGITYNDGTPPIAYTYRRDGQVASITDAAGTRDFVYDSSKPWRLLYEDLPSSGGGFFYGDRLLTRTYDAATSTSAGTLASHTKGTVLGRIAGVKLGTPATPASDLEFAYPTSNTGRIAGVVSSRNSGGTSRTFTYGYEPNSPLLKSLAIEGSHPFALTRDFESSRDLITSVEAKWSATSRTKYAYVYNDLRQRQSVVQTGDVFNDYGGADHGAIHQIFTYNSRSELTAAATFLGASATDQSQPLSARKHEFAYDGIGNRRWSNTSGNSTLREDYTVNELNQYTLKENNTLAVGGTVADDANIKVAAGDTTAALAGRRGRHWGDNITLENWVAPFQGALNIYAVNPVTNKKMVETRTAFIPPIAQAMTYDEDGNILNDGVWTYEWDAENRLRAMETTGNAVAGGVPAQRLEFKYDHQHRRIEKLVRGGWNGSTFATITAQRRYLYDGWSLIAEFSFNVQLSTLNLVRSYTWGLDIARSLTDAGGVGALLQIADHTSGKTYLPSYDGNGNIAALFDGDSANGTIAAAYEYSPYGEFLRCEGSYAKENPFRFSTKFTDNETGLVYYGLRYYSPSQGRFLGRDPIAEQGGLNLYGFCRNNSINLWDVLGLSGRDEDDDDGDDDIDEIISQLDDEHLAHVMFVTNYGINGDGLQRAANPGSSPFAGDYRNTKELKELSPEQIDKIWEKYGKYFDLGSPGTANPPGTPGYARYQEIVNRKKELIAQVFSYKMPDGSTPVIVGEIDRLLSALPEGSKIAFGFTGRNFTSRPVNGSLRIEVESDATHGAQMIYLMHELVHAGDYLTAKGLNVLEVEGPARHREIYRMEFQVAFDLLGYLPENNIPDPRKYINPPKK